MTELTRIADQLDRAVTGEAWHGPSLMEVLRDVDTETASHRPIDGAHTIHEIALHVTAWTRQIRERLEGQGTRRLTGEDDWPPAGPVQASEWQRDVQRLVDEHDRLRQTILALHDDVLEQDQTYTWLHGIIQHNLYHAGQMALLKKAAVQTGFRQ